MTQKTRTCIGCGATFARSRADYTVRCADCRKTRRAVHDGAVSQHDIDRMAARNAARKARADYGRQSVQYRDAVAYAIRIGAIDAAAGAAEMKAVS